MRVIAGKWWDGTWWEGDLADSCIITEQSNQHVRFTLPGGGKGLVGLRKHFISEEEVRLRGLPLSALVRDVDAWSRELTEGAADPTWPAALKHKRQVPNLERHQLGYLLGYTFEKPDALGAIQWSGYLGHMPWGVYVNVACASEARSEARRTVLGFLASMEFKAPV